LPERRATTTLSAMRTPADTFQPSARAFAFFFSR
jgi:hypothetical protein